MFIKPTKPKIAVPGKQLLAEYLGVDQKNVQQLNFLYQYDGQQYLVVTDNETTPQCLSIAKIKEGKITVVNVTIPQGKDRNQDRYEQPFGSNSRREMLAKFLNVHPTSIQALSRKQFRCNQITYFVLHKSEHNGGGITIQDGDYIICGYHIQRIV